ncbi:MAG: ATP-binding cassette domain-containing protein, partial [Gemmatimonadota bacterium]|nr:ATP-binding cassette domain-containing protein [Gemmatimonadota bacterium]
MSQSDEILTIKGLHIEGKTDEGWSEIVKGVDLSLKKGEILGLIGESGAGKSTIGLAAMGYARGGCRISAGEIIFDGHNLLEMSNKGQRRIRGRRIAYVAQSAAASFNPAYKLIDQYSEGPVFHHVMSKSEAEHDAKELYRRMQLPDPEMIGYRYPHQVSGGQLQRAITAMAMSCRPDIIIFDEPTTALDVTTQIEVLSAIRDIVNQSGTAAIYITHDLAVVAQMADRVKVLLKGAEIEEADTRTMLRAPRDTYTKSLWAVRSFQATPKKIESTTRPVVSVQNVSAAYETQLVLTDVSFDIFPCQTVAVV